MTVTMLKSKIHRATVTQAELDYVGSITVDVDLLEQAGIFEYEKVQIADVDNGNRFETYVIAGERESGVICLNGAAARCVNNGDKVIIMAYAQMDAQPAGGENIQTAKREIEATLDTLNVAFEKLLDDLFLDTAWDISSDISVLNTMLAQEGLKEDGLKGK